MFKKLKYIAIASVWLSLFTLLLHSFIPHHHHNPEIHNHHAECFHYGSVTITGNHSHEHSSGCNDECPNTHCFNCLLSNDLSYIPAKFQITAELTLLREDFVFIPVINIVNIEHDVNQLYSSPPSLFKTRGPPYFFI